jgi:hypothetical protein
MLIRIKFLLKKSPVYNRGGGLTVIYFTAEIAEDAEGQKIKIILDILAQPV